MKWWWLAVGAVFPLLAAAGDVLETDGFSFCQSDPPIDVDRMKMSFDRSTQDITFNVAGSSKQVEKVSVLISFSAYGKWSYENQFNPCENATYVPTLCPLPAGPFNATGSQKIPAEYASQIPGIAFSIPDIDGLATLKLISLDGGQTMACIQSTITNGKTAQQLSVTYVSAAIAGAALMVSMFSAAASGSGTGSGGGPSPSFIETAGWFQSMAINGMLTVSYPPVYASFTRNFGFSTGLITWEGLQNSIDSFRAKTGGNLTESSVGQLRNTSLSAAAGSETVEGVTRRALLYARDTAVSNGTDSESGLTKTADGFQAYVEKLSIPQTNTFMTVLLVMACAIGAITVGILLFKVILETWALFGNFPKSLTTFRKKYWLTLAKTITNLILLLYGMWTLYCVYQFSTGDSWAAKLLAAVTWAIFTGILGFFTFKIWKLARQSKQDVGDVSTLYEKKEVWVKYSLFYENYKKNAWWIFIPAIVYMLAKSCIIAGANGHGLVQVAGQIALEALMLILLVFVRPYGLKSGNWINISIQVIRVLSAVFILVFVEKLGVSQTTKTATGMVLVIVQSVLTGILAILIAINAIVLCCKANPHRKKRKEAEKGLGEDYPLDRYSDQDTRQSLVLNGSRLGHDKDDDGFDDYPPSGRRSHEYLLRPDEVNRMGPQHHQHPDEFYPSHGGKY